MSKTINTSIGEKIAYFRKLKGWSQQEFANRMGINRSTISRYEVNANEVTLSQMQEIATALDITVLDLIVNPEDSNKVLLGRELTKDELKAKVNQLEIELAASKREIEDKNKIIELYEQHIEHYKKSLIEASNRDQKDL